MDTYLYAGRMILPDILPFLQSDGVSHEQFKVRIAVMCICISRLYYCMCHTVDQSEDSSISVQKISILR